jgi:acyl-CoA synthetase (NDP forming)
MLEARSVALVGASPRPGSLGERMIAEVTRSPAAPRVYLVNPRYTEIAGRPCHPSLSDLPEPMDLLLLGVPDSALAGQLRLAAGRGDRSAVIFGGAHDSSGGNTPGRDGSDSDGSGRQPGLRAELTAIARGAGMALCGAGCMGFVNVSHGLRAVGYIEADELPGGPIALVTHSGSVFSAMLRTRRAIGFTVAVSSGQELVTSAAEYAQYALGLPRTRVLALVLEAMRDTGRLRRVLAEACRRDIPVVMLTAGRSTSGRAMVAAHSGALAGADGAWEALAAAYGIHRVYDFAEMSDTLEVFAAGRRVSPARPAPYPYGEIGTAHGSVTESPESPESPSPPISHGRAVVNDHAAAVDRSPTGDHAAARDLPATQDQPAAADHAADGGRHGRADDPGQPAAPGRLTPPSRPGAVAQPTAAGERTPAAQPTAAGGRTPAAQPTAAGERTLADRPAVARPTAAGQRTPADQPAADQPSGMGQSGADQPTALDRLAAADEPAAADEAASLDGPAAGDESAGDHAAARDLSTAGDHPTAIDGAPDRLTGSPASTGTGVAAGAGIAGAGIATVHDSGLERAHVADLADELGVPFGRIGERTRRRLAEVLDAGLEPANPLDMWGGSTNAQWQLTESLVILAGDPAVAAIALAVDLVPEFDGDRSYPLAVLDAARRTAKPVAVLTNIPAAIDPVAAADLRAGGIPVLEGARSGLLALGHLLGHARRPSRPEPPPVQAARRDRWSHAIQRGELTAEALARLLADYGIATAQVIAVDGPGAALAAAARIGYPVVLKTGEPGIAHKSDVGGVVLGISDAAALADTYRDVATRLGPRALICETASPGVELSVGIAADPGLGPLVVVGAGGVLVEHLSDRAVALPPVDATAAAQMLRRLRVTSLLAGTRGRPPADLEAVTRAIAAVATLACELGPCLAALDINPLVCGPRGAVAVDALLVQHPQDRPRTRAR